MKPTYLDKFSTQEWGLTQSLRIKPPFILFHGGLGDQLVDRKQIFASLRKVAQISKKSIEKSALDLAQTTVAALEDDPIFNAGFGAKLQRDGVPRLSAAIMDGSRQRMASVSNILSQRHPSALVRDLLKDSDRNLNGIEASLYAFSQGFEPESVKTPQRVQEWLQKIEGKTGTVGAVAIDADGKTAACTSTGGRGSERPGRTSDSFTPAGNFATPFGAVSCTGIGEEILEAAVASSILVRIEDGMSLTEAVSRTYSRHQHCRFGSIAIDHRGHALVYATRGAVTFGVVTPSEFYIGMLPSDWNKICAKLSL